METASIFPDADDLAVYEEVRGLIDHELEQLEALLIALTFGIISRPSTNVGLDLCLSAI